MSVTVSLYLLLSKLQPFLSTAVWYMQLLALGNPIIGLESQRVGNSVFKLYVEETAASEGKRVQAIWQPGFCIQVQVDFNMTKNVFRPWSDHICPEGGHY